MHKNLLFKNKISISLFTIFYIIFFKNKSIISLLTKFNMNINFYFYFFDKIIQKYHI